MSDTRRLSLTARILIGLVLGLGGGATLAALSPGLVPRVLAVADPVGGLWVDGLRMTIIPLVFSLLVTSVTTAAGTVTGSRVAGRALAGMALLLVLSAALAAFLMPALLTVLPIPSAAAEALRRAGESTESLGEMPPLGQFLRTLVPSNPIQAAATDAMVPLIVFALLFGFATARIELALRTQLTGFFEAMTQVMLVLVQWVLAVAPLGVFSLALGVGARAGTGAAVTLLHYLGLIIALALGVTLCCYVLAALGARLSPGRFARAVAPAQVIAFSTQSSIASLPAMLEAARVLGVPEAVRGLVLPLAVSLFRITSPALNVGVALYLASLHGVDVSAGRLALAVFVAPVMTLAGVGLPSQTTFFTTIGPVCLVLGVPLDVLPLMLAVETLPDLFRTVGNVTGDVVLTRLVTPRAAPDA